MSVLETSHDQDLYNADIVIHETNVEPQEVDIAARIGCELP